MSKCTRSKIVKLKTNRTHVVLFTILGIISWVFSYSALSVSHLRKLHPRWPRGRQSGCDKEFRLKHRFNVRAKVYKSRVYNSGITLRSLKTEKNGLRPQVVWLRLGRTIQCQTFLPSQKVDFNEFRNWSVRVMILGSLPTRLVNSV